MKMDELVALITEKVRERMEASENKKKILVAGQSGGPCFTGCYELLKELSCEIHDIGAVEKDGSLEEYEAIIVPCLGVKEMTDTALGIMGGSCQSVLIRCMLEGRKAYIIEEGMAYKRYQSTCSSRFFDMLGGYEEKLRSFGLNIISGKDLPGALKTAEAVRPPAGDGAPEAPGAPAAGKCCRPEKRIITETDVRSFCSQGFKEIALGRKTIITPLAIDCIKVNSMRLIRE